ncbi:hypothetical protein [Mesorhizobium sp. M0088]|uniref:hypothetical protein n=1 Tax=Mesorhizobium sp. M0088 TaxID=2956873 RepID=UPI0033356E8B
MSEHDPTEPPNMTEPDTVWTRFVTVTKVEVTEHFVRIVALDDFAVVGYDGAERRIVSRLVMPIDAARDLERDLRKALRSGSH